ncbi:MFS transporter [Saccharophagus sp. K07]|jgi:GPH family glycoside/pentoside/hexuronide:cation symporter|uniref:MFS transporter n=1 Tax=Saccharophagus sp. K07 TaxID=2283636 RepID=UPI0016527805|nr:MFS transporter [Saccharophagus sp. K07]MBC6905278.1 MFS transporter [Saccharophagus sp. K07]
MNSHTDKLSVIEKVGYSLGDLAANLIFQTLVTFIAFFYTDVYGIPPGQASVIIFICGWAGAFFSPVVGVLADRTKTRWGKFRPWVLFTSIPFGVLSLLAFSTPDLSDSAKVFYAFATYLALMLIYSANNLPYAALSGVLTGNMQQRNSLSAYRFVAVMVAQFIIQALLLPLVLIAGDGDKAVGFKNVMTFFAITGVIFFIITFLTTKERVQPVVEKSRLSDDIKDLTKNLPWVLMLLVTVLVFIGLALKGGSYIYYFQYYVSAPDAARFLDEIGFNAFINGLNGALTSAGFAEFAWPEDPATSMFSLFNAGGIILMIIGIGFSKPLADKFGKRDVYAIGLVIATVFMLAFYVFPPEAVWAIFISQILHGFFYGITIPLLWAMIADVADYSEWKNNRRATAIIFSAMLFGLKGGLTIGGALVAGLLDLYGYDANAAVQTDSAINGIKLSVSLYASLPFLTAAALLYFYEINKAKEITIERDLAERRKNAGITQNA